MKGGALCRPQPSSGFFPGTLPVSFHVPDWAFVCSLVLKFRSLCCWWESIHSGGSCTRLVNTVTGGECSPEQTSSAVSPPLSLVVVSPPPPRALSHPRAMGGAFGSWGEGGSGLVVAYWEGACFLLAGIASIGLAAAYYSGGEMRHVPLELPRLTDGKLEKRRGCCCV